MSSELQVVAGSLTVDAYLVKFDTLSDLLEQSLPNLRRLSNREQPEVLRTLLDKFFPKTKQSAVECKNHPRNEPSGREPLADSRLETVAQFLATPKSERELKSVTALAKHLEVARKTIHLWVKNLRVHQRAQHLTACKQREGDLIARRNWPSIMQAMSEHAMKGNVGAARYAGERAWRDEVHTVQPIHDLLAPYRTPKETEDDAV
jgi:transposase-like protein